MRRLLCCAVALELVVGSLALAALPERSGGEFGPASAAGGSSGSKDTVMASASTGSSTAHARSVAAQGKTSGRSSGTPGRQISFRPPVDFATGAFPPATAFNMAAGDQLGLSMVHATLSDGVAAGDFDGDGNDDVAQTNVIAGTVSVFFGNGRGGFRPPESYAVGVHPSFVVAHDLDLDGYIDLAVANSGSGTLAILNGVGAGKFRPASFVAVPHPRNIAIGSFDGDDMPDLAVASSPAAPGCPARCDLSPVGGVAVLRASRTAGGPVTYEPAQVITPTHSADDRPVGANYVAVGDFDGSGFDDLAVGVGTRRSAGARQDGDTSPTGDDLLVFLNRNRPGEEPFTAAPDQHAIRVGATPDAIAVGDWNGDAHPDLAVLGNGSGDITTLLGDGRGRFVVVARNVTVGAAPRSLAAADFNGDGVGDLVTASFGASTVSVLRGNDGGNGTGDGTFQPAVDFWAGNAPTSVAVGHFDGDRRLDVVVGRLRTDQLSLLRNSSPQRGDGVVITRDIPYGSPTHPTNDPFASRHTLDVYSPPRGTPSFAGRGQRYPVVFFVHGGSGISGDKTVVSYFMRSLARKGIVGVSTNYRLGFGMAPDQEKDIVQAFRWTRDHATSPRHGGDPDKIFLFAHSAGGGAVVNLATDPQYAAEQRSIAGFVLVGVPAAAERAAAAQPPSLLMNGTEGLEVTNLIASAAFSRAASALGADSTHFIVRSRDHWTVLANMARPHDEGRGHLLAFIRTHV